MTPDMEFQCLLISSDQQIVNTVNRHLRSLSIKAELCLTSSKAYDLLKNGGFDLTVIDWQDDSGELVKQIREAPSWKKLTVVAICEREGPAPSAHFVLHKPVTDTHSASSLRAAYSRMLFDHRRHARFAIMQRVGATCQNKRTVDVLVLDIGDGGFGFSSKEQFLVGDLLEIRLGLPGTKRAIHIEAQVRWTRQHGVVGCEYVRIPPVDLNILRDWIRGKAQVKKPLLDFSTGAGAPAF